MGIDPGPSTGIALLNLEDGCSPEWYVFQVNGPIVNWQIISLFPAFSPRAVEYEEFVVSNRAGTKGKAAQETRMIADQVPGLVRANCRKIPPVFVVARRATDAFGWATEKRLEQSL